MVPKTQSTNGLTLNSKYHLFVVFFFPCTAQPLESTDLCKAGVPEWASAFVDAMKPSQLLEFADVCGHFRMPMCVIAMHFFFNSYHRGTGVIGVKSTKFYCFFLSPSRAKLLPLAKIATWIMTVGPVVVQRMPLHKATADLATLVSVKQRNTLGWKMDPGAVQDTSVPQ
jgi:hypothetical protein